MAVGVFPYEDQELAERDRPHRTLDDAVSRTIRGGRAKSGNATTCTRWILNSLEGKLATMGSDRRNLLSDAEIGRIRHLVSIAASDPAWDSLPICRVHDDFTHSNILVRPDGSVSILDFADARVGFALEDVVRFWCSIWEIAQCHGRRSDALTPCLSVILRANGLTEAICDSPPFAMLRVWNAVNTISAAIVGTQRFSWSTRRSIAHLVTVQRSWLLEWLRRAGAAEGGELWKIV